MIKKRFISMLVLLAAVATGARAAWTGGTYTATANENLDAITVNGDATLTINSDVTVTVTGGINVASGTLTVTGPGTLVVTGSTGSNGSKADGHGGNGGVAISGNIIVQGSATVTATGGTGGNADGYYYGGDGGVAISGNIIVQGSATVTATGGNGGNGGTSGIYGEIGGNGGNAFAGTLTYKSGTVTANGGSGGSGGSGMIAPGSNGSTGKAFANDVDFTQTTMEYTLTDGSNTITTISNQKTVVIAEVVFTGYSVSLKSGTEDATSWQGKAGEGEYQALPLEGVAAGTAVTVKFSGTKRVKSVKAKKKANIVNLSTLEGDYVAQNGDVLTGTLEGSERPYKISIADGATVTLDNATINGVAGYASDPRMAESGMYDGFYRWCGLTCEGDATIILKDGSTNAVKGFYHKYPGIYVPENKTLTIKGGVAGTGKLTAQNGTEGKRSGTGAGIGAGYNLSCGHINIQGGEITATGQSDCAGIGGANNGNCGNITISGGKINATGDGNAAGIGGGAFMSCGDITIESTVISVTATSGSSNACSIGKGYNGSCGTVTIGGTVYADGVATSPFTYPTAP